MPEMGIKSDAWNKVAQQEANKSENEENGLFLELVVELRDRQRNSFAITFQKR